MFRGTGMRAGSPNRTVKVRAEGLEPPQAIAHQDLNLTEPVPACPVRSRKANDYRGFWGFSHDVIPARTGASHHVGLQFGCSASLSRRPTVRAAYQLLGQPTRRRRP